MTRYAIVTGQASRLATIQAYMPSNYSAAAVGEDVLVTGTDSAGWTLDGYVLPRLASGLYFGREVTEDDALLASIYANGITTTEV